MKSGKEKMLAGEWIAPQEAEMTVGRDHAQHPDTASCDHGITCRTMTVCGAIIGAGAVVARTFPAGFAAASPPAHIIRTL